MDLWGIYRYLSVFIVVYQYLLPDAEITENIDQNILGRDLAGD